jgi:hypothetical protein
MKCAFLSILFLASFPVRAVCAENEPLVPAPLNSVLPRIKAGMTAAEARAQLTNAYPKVQLTLGVWSGQTGYLDFRLDDRYTVSFAARNPPNGTLNESAAILSDNLLTYIFDHQRKHRLEISHFQWDASPDSKPKKSQPGRGSNNRQ